MTRLLLFDIDNTLLYTGGAGVAAMNLAFREMFGGVDDGFGKANTSGRTDLYILSEGLRHHVINDGHKAHLDEFLRRYYSHLRRTLGEREGHLMPGFPQLLEVLSQREGVGVGLATGNFSEAAWMKLDHYGIRQFFADGAFGEGSLDRSEMVRLGIERFGDGVAPQDILIIGDTPHDISSALDNGLGAVGVATGNYTVDQLRDSGAQLVFGNFADWEGAAAKLAGEAGSPRQDVTA